MKLLFQGKLFYVGLSILLAFFLLFYVDSIENPFSEKTYTLDLDLRGLSGELYVDPSPRPIRIRLSGNKTSFYTLSTREIQAWVDLSQAQPGNSLYPIQTSLPNGVSLVWVEPRSMDLFVDEMVSRDLPLRYDIVHTPESGYGHFEPILSLSEIKVTGPRQELALLDHALVRINLEKMTTDFEGELPVLLVGENQTPVEHPAVRLNQTMVEVKVPITENMSSKIVQVRPALTGQLQETRVVDSVEIQPTTVRITGAFDVIKDIEYLTTETVDLTTLEQSFDGQVELNIPEGVGVLDGTKVNLRIVLAENLMVRTITGVPVAIRNGPGDRSYGSAPSQVSVQLEAYPWIFESMVKEDGSYEIDLRAFVDLKGAAADSRDYQVEVEAPADFQIQAVLPDTVRLHRQ